MGGGGHCWPGSTAQGYYWNPAQPLATTQLWGVVFSCWSLSKMAAHLQYHASFPGGRQRGDWTNHTLFQPVHPFNGQQQGPAMKASRWAAHQSLTSGLSLLWGPCGCGRGNRTASGFPTCNTQRGTGTDCGAAVTVKTRASGTMSAVVGLQPRRRLL